MLRQSLRPLGFWMVGVMGIALGCSGGGGRWHWRRDGFGRSLRHWRRIEWVGR